MAALEPAAPGRVRVWLEAARPRTLLASVAPVLVGSAVAAAEGGAAIGPALAALAGALCLQVGSNLVNDYADFLRGSDGPDRLGPPRAAQMGWLHPAELRAAAGLSFAVAVLVGAYLVARGGWPIAVGGGLAVLAAWAYTGGPAPLGYRGLGDPLVFVFFGLFAVAGTHWVQVGESSGLVWLASVPVGLLATAILAVNNLRDLEGDARAGKRTLAVRFGERGARRYLEGLLSVPYACLPLLPVLGGSLMAALLPLLSLPLALRLARELRLREGAGLNPLLGAVAALEAVFCLLLAVGLLL